MVLLIAGIGVMAAQIGAPPPPTPFRFEVPPGQVQIPVEPCLHSRSGESVAEAERRTDALAVMRMIDWAFKAQGLPPGDMAWRTLLKDTQAVRKLETEPGRVGQLAARVAWGAEEPLPGWRLTWGKPTPMQVVYSLTDTRDPCRFVYRSSDPGVLTGGPYGVMPLGPASY